MTQQIINVGAVANDGTGDALRNAFVKTNDNFTELYTTKANSSNLAATTSGNGASLIGVQDSGAYYTSTNVEGALQEIGSTISGLSSPSGAASLIGITDSGGYYTSTNVEGALQEIGAVTVGGDTTGASLVGFQQFGTDTTALRNAQQKLREMISIKDWATSVPTSGITDWSLIEADAHASTDPGNPSLSAALSIEYPFQRGETYPGAENFDDVYDTTNTNGNATWKRIQSGTRAAPTDQKQPIVLLNKIINSSQAGPIVWDEGCHYSQVTKVSGSIFAAAVTGNVRHEGGTGHMIGVHGRGIAKNINAEVWGSWSYVASRAIGGHKTLIGHEINVDNAYATDYGWQTLPTTGSTRGLVIASAFGTTNNTLGIEVSVPSGAGKWYTGVLFSANSIVSNDAVASTIGNNEFIRFQGDTTGIGAHAIRFENGNFRTGICFVGGTFLNNTAMLVSNNHRITVGTPASTTYLSFNGSTNTLNMNDLDLYRSGTKVVGARRTGWAPGAGTATRTTFNTTTVTLEALAERFKALLDDLIAHGLIGA